MSDGRLRFIIDVDNKGVVKITDMKGKVKGLGKETVKESKKMGSAFSGMWKQFAAGTLIANAVQTSMRSLARSLKDTIGDVINFEAEWANVTTLMDQSQEYTGDMRDSLVDMAGELGSTQDLAKGMYQTLSAGVDPSKALEFLGKSAKFARAGITDMYTSVDVLTTVVNAYGLEAENVTEVSDTLFEIIKQGKTTGQELAGALGRIIPTAATMGVNLREVGAAMATLTKGGIKTQESVIALNQTLMAVISASPEIRKAARDMGLDFTRAGIEGAGGLQKWLVKVKDALGDDEVAMKNLFPNVRALKAVFALAGNQADEYARQIVNMGNVTGNTEIAFKKQMATVKATAEAIKNQFTAQVTAALLPALKDVRDFLNANSSAIADLGKGIGNAAKLIFGLIKILYDFRDVLKIVGTFMLTMWATNKMKAWGNNIVMNETKVGGLTGKVGGLGKMLTKNAVPALMAAVVAGKALAKMFENIGKKHDAAMAKMVTYTNAQKTAIDKVRAYREQASFIDQERIKIMIESHRELRESQGLTGEMTKESYEKVIEALKYTSAEYRIYEANLGKVKKATVKLVDENKELAKTLKEIIAKPLGQSKLTLPDLEAAKADMQESDAKYLQWVADERKKAVAAYTKQELEANQKMYDDMGKALDGFIDVARLAFEILGDLGVEVSDEFVSTLDKSLSAGQSALQGDWVKAATEQASAWWDVLKNIFEKTETIPIKSNAEKIKEYLTEIGTEFTSMIDEAKKLGVEGSAQILDIIRDMERSGKNIAEITAYIISSLDSGIPAVRELNKTVGDTVAYSEAFFEAYKNQGLSLSEIFEKMGDTLPEPFRKLAEENKAVIESLGHTQTVLEALGNANALSADAFIQNQKEASSYYDQLLKSGVQEQTALELMAPLLAQQVWYANQYNYELDAKTQKMIDEAKARGINIDGMKTEQQMQLENNKAMARLVELFEQLLGLTQAETDAMSALGKQATKTWDQMGNVSYGTPLGPDAGMGGYASGTNNYYIPRPGGTFRISEGFNPELVSITPSGHMKVQPIDADAMKGGRSGGRSIQINMGGVNLEAHITVEGGNGDPEEVGNQVTYALKNYLGQVRGAVKEVSEEVYRELSSNG